MKILICAGGTGSIALQKGLYQYEKEFPELEVKILINGFDSGLSTGLCRQVMDNKILGPSDLRKNHSTRLALVNPKSPWHEVLDHRFTVASSEAFKYCLDELTSIETKNCDKLSYKIDTPKIREAINHFFSKPLSKLIDYNDFSLSNIIYAGLASLNNNSLRTAGSIMAGILGIPDNVILNDDTSLFLSAETMSGKSVSDEADIVAWNSEDSFVDVTFKDDKGESSWPVLCLEAYSAIVDADLVILSSGTLWSSLIPTYASEGFTDAIEDSKAKFIMVMNRQPDHDSPAQTAEDILNIVASRYFKNKLHVITDKTGHEQFTSPGSATDQILSFSGFYLKFEYYSSERKHDPDKLAQAIMKVYFKDYLDSDFFVFDYDDTLVGRGNTFPKASKYNQLSISGLNEIANIAICTGNTIKAISFMKSQIYKTTHPIMVYADGGINLYEYDTQLRNKIYEDEGDLDEAVRNYNFVECINPKASMKDKIADVTSLLQDNGIPSYKIDNRGDAMISIKPIDPEYRPIVLSFVKSLLKDQDFRVYACGRTTVEIIRPALSKIAAIEHIRKITSAAKITYVGDEFNGGNDAPIKFIPGVSCLEVKNPVHTALFLDTLKESLNAN